MSGADPRYDKTCVQRAPPAPLPSSPPAAKLVTAAPEGAEQAEVREAIRLVTCCAEDIWRHLGPGLEQEHYCRALEIALAASGAVVSRERWLPIRYRHATLGRLQAPLLMRALAIVVGAPGPRDERGCERLDSLLRLSCRRTGLSVTFGPRGAEVEERWLEEALLLQIGGAKTEGELAPLAID